MACVVAGIRSGGFGLSLPWGTSRRLWRLDKFWRFAVINVSSVPGAWLRSLVALGAVAGATGPFASLADPTCWQCAIPLLQLTSQVDSFSSLGSAFDLGSGSITGLLGTGFESIGEVGVGFADALANHAGELFGSSSSANAIQTLAGAEAFAAMSMDIAGPVANALTGQFGAAEPVVSLKRCL